MSHPPPPPALSSQMLRSLRQKYSKSKANLGKIKDTVFTERVREHLRGKALGWDKGGLGYKHTTTVNNPVLLK